MSAVPVSLLMESFQPSAGSISGAGGDQGISAEDEQLLKAVVEGKSTMSYLDGSVLKVMAPINTSEGQVIGATLVGLPTENVQQAMQQQLRLATLVAILVLAIGILASIFLSRRVTEPVAQIITAAAAVEANQYEALGLEDVLQRTDELGQLARVFQEMAEEVHAREQWLMERVQKFVIDIDAAKKGQRVAEITETDYFRDLQSRVRRLQGQNAP